tara:strand:- start:1201 stop:1668 length:468 start_codon:yes stop_codon:yes gene_type:complete
MLALIDHPTTRREERSITAAAYSHLSAVQIGEVGHRLLVRPVGRKLAIEHVADDDRALTMILGKTAPRPRPKTLLAMSRSIWRRLPDIPSASRSCQTYVAGTDLRTDHLVVAGTLRWRTDQPGTEATPRDTQRPAHPCNRPDISVHRNKLESHIE